MRLRSLPVLLVPVVLLAACGGDDSSSDGTSAPVATEAPAGSEAPSGTDAPAAEKPQVEIPDSIPTELTVTTLQEGSGPEAVDGDTVIVDYVGVLSKDGTEFDNSYDSGAPFPVTLGAGNVIAGWDQGLVGVQAGERVQLDIPSDLAYGPTGQGSIGPDEALTFVVDVRAVLGAVDPADAPTDVSLPPADGVTELQSTDVIVGEGAAAEAGDTTYVNVIVYDSTGEELDSTWTSGNPVELVLDETRTLAGLAQGVVGMQPGGRRILVVPADLAFGDEGNEQYGVEPGEPLIVLVDLVATV